MTGWIRNEVLINRRTGDIQTPDNNHGFNKLFCSQSSDWVNNVKKTQAGTTLCAILVKNKTSDKLN